MAAHVTIHIFAGRPNPVVTLNDTDAARWLATLAKPQAGGPPQLLALPGHPTLGYRGLTVEQVGTLVAGLPRTFKVANGDVITASGSWHAGTAFEDFISASSGPVKALNLEAGFASHLTSQITAFRGARVTLMAGAGVPEPPPACPCGPAYDPAPWSEPPAVGLNNCYNYACNQRTDTVAEPGRGSGKMYTEFQCASVLPAAVADGLMACPNADNNCPPEGNLVALVMSPSIDYHWYRKGADGFWTHKMGNELPTNLDNGGHLITDPRHCLRDLYVIFCTFMAVVPGKINIR